MNAQHALPLRDTESPIRNRVADIHANPELLASIIQQAILRDDTITQALVNLYLDGYDTEAPGETGRHAIAKVLEHAEDFHVLIGSAVRQWATLTQRLIDAKETTRADD